MGCNLSINIELYTAVWLSIISDTEREALARCADEYGVSFNLNYRADDADRTREVPMK